MKLTLARIGRSETVRFAAKELERCLRQMDPLLFVESRIYDVMNPQVEGVLWLGLDGSVAADEQDEICIKVEKGAGVITGSNERSVLMAAYRFLFELGCRFLRPGADGEVIPARRLDADALQAEVCEKASYRHRAICIEGASGYEHVYNMIDWLPKVGMSGYFMQFHTPSAFFKRFYNRDVNPHVETAPVTDDDIAHIWKSLEEEIVKRGLDYHAAGHGWTCEPFGIHATSWGQYDGEVSEETKQYFAEINGVRELWRGVALNTNLCYSNPAVRDKMTDAIVRYCIEHPAVNFLHVWLADGSNNHCECAECVKKLPSDYYVILLNELDKKLTEAGVTTKIVCLIYVDLLWAPESEKIVNQDRFVLMFAPITRTYTNAFTDFDITEQVELTPYVRNKLVMPKSVAENVARLSRWQKEQLQGDSFDFDYHMMWDHYLDPGYYECARILHKDMANLDKIGLNGMVSCQLQRTAFPTGLPIYAMAKALWNKKSTFEEVCEEYFTAAFGEDGSKVEKYLSTLSELFDPAYLRGEKELNPAAAEEKLLQAKEVIAAFEKEELAAKAEKNASWQYLKHHAEIVTQYADTLIAYIGTHVTEEGKEQALLTLQKLMHEKEPLIHTVFDPTVFHSIYRKYLPKLS